MTGIRAWPWVRRYRNESKAPGYLDCTECRKSFSAPIRAAYHCAYIARADWTYEIAQYPRAHDPDGQCESDQCPGYMLALPGVTEAIRAFLHWDKGHDVRDRFGVEPTDALQDAIEELAGAFALVEQWLMDRAKRKR